MDELNNSTVKCEICGKEFEHFKGLSSHVWQIHNIKKEEYYLKYIGIKGVCKICGKDTKFIGLRIGYNKFCGPKCSNMHPETKQKCIDTFIKKYGCKSSNQCEEVKNRKKETCLKNWNCENPSQNKEIRNRQEETCLKNHGVRHACQNKEIKNRQEETCLKNHGVRHASQNKEIRNRQEETCLKNHGVRYSMQNSKVREKSIKTNIIKYGVENYKQTDESKKRSRLSYQQCLERYPDVVKIEELKEGPNGEIMGHCKNSSCKNSKENGGYFELMPGQINMRNTGINTHDTGHFYCCEECKQSCPLYGRSATALHNRINENPEIHYTSAEYNTWKEEVYYRQKIENNTETNFCEYCHATENLHVHHEVPQKIVPGYALDPINGIIACEDCHYKYGHEKGTDCSTGNLANKICK